MRPHFYTRSLTNLLCAVLLLIALPLRAQDAEVPRTRTFPGIEDPAFPYAQPEDVGLSSEKLDRLGDEITEWVANGELVGGELLIIKDGTAVFHEAYGWSDREEAKPVERNSIWSIKSMSKPFTAAAILMLEKDGELSLDDRVTEFIPSFAGNDSTTVRHLLTHTSGYAGLAFGMAHFTSLKEWVEAWAKREPTEVFGQYSYADFNYAALGYIIETVSGVAADSFLEERIIEPLGLTETYTAFSPDTLWASRVNSRYRWNHPAREFERYWTNEDPQGWSYYPAAFGLWGTAMDYAEFMTMWLNKGSYEGARILSQGTVEEALKPHAPPRKDGYRRSFSYGYGWFVKEEPASDKMPFFFGHGGFDGTIAIAYSGADAIVVFLTHSRGRGSLDALQNRLGMLEIFDDPGPYSVNLTMADMVEYRLAPSEQDRYVGTYRGQHFVWEDNPEIVAHVFEEENRLHLRVGLLDEQADWHLHLVPLGRHRFALGRYRGGRLEAVDSEGTLRFIMDGGKAEDLELAAEGKVEFSAERADPDVVRADIKADRKRVNVHEIVLETLEEEGIQQARGLYRTLLAARPDSVRFGESLLNSLGYRLLGQERVEEAIAVLEMNVEAHPDEANPYDSLADAYRAAGRLEEARRNYERAVKLAEQEGHENLQVYRSKLQQVTSEMREE